MGLVRLRRQRLREARPRRDLGHVVGLPPRRPPSRRPGGPGGGRSGSWPLLRRLLGRFLGAGRRGGLRRLPGLLSGRRLAGGRWRLVGLLLGCGLRTGHRLRFDRRLVRGSLVDRHVLDRHVLGRHVLGRHVDLGRRDRTAPRCRTGRQVESSSLLSQLHVRTEALVGGTRLGDLVADRFRMRQGLVDRLGDQVVLGPAPVVLGPAPVVLGPLPGRVLDRRRPPRHRRGRERDRRPRPVGDLWRRLGRRPGRRPRRPRLPRRADRRAQDQPGAEGQQHHADHDHRDRERTHVAHARRSGTPTSLTGPPPIGHDPVADTYP